jgi:hypothetical protein
MPESNETLTTQEGLTEETGVNPIGEPPKALLNVGTYIRSVDLKLVLRVIGHLLLSIGLIVVVVGSGLIFANDAEKLGNDWVANLRPGRRPPTDSEPLLPRERTLINPGIVSKQALTPTEESRLQNQLDDIRKKAKHHLDVAVYYYSRSFMAILAFSLAAALAAICLAIISKRGLDKVSEYIVTLFLVATALAVFYQSFPGVFQQRKNVDANRALYIKYVNLEDDMISYVATGSIVVIQTTIVQDPPREQTGGSGKSDPSNPDQTAAPKTVGTQYSILTLTPAEFIHYVDYHLKSYNDIAIGFDESKAASFAKEQFQTQ